MDPEPARAVAIAEKNRTIRPDGEARTRLAQAYLRAGRSADARAEIDKVIATSWSSGETWATAALVFGACGDAAASTEASAKAKAIDPFASESVAWLARAPR
jgi:Tfp pilus assembly protein PilF